MLQNRTITVMTLNAYVGTNLGPLFSTTATQLPIRVTEVFRQFLATNIPSRVNGFAAEIKRARPDIVGLYEMDIVQLLAPSGSGAPSATYDFLNLLLKALRRMGLHYRVIAIGKNYDGLAPASTGYTVRLFDRNIILARRGAPLSFSNVQNFNFNQNTVITLGGRPFPILHGFSTVDVVAYGKKFRFAAAHLDGYTASVRFAQVNQLIRTLANPPLPVVLVGDFNSNALRNGRVYRRVLRAGYTDAWTQKGIGPGPTYGFDYDLLNVGNSLFERVDYILYKGKKAFTVRKIFREGQTQRARIPSSPLWPSDTASVVAQLRLN
ncbi:endonuclease/exonuclease/phosphatase family protein [Marininema halotolerans]|uniref:Metal-dependent hydrolase, endonuclease/exonuclease/phosphatase family n=1 Tax=Marininema halotolerans TaxID=1155944 RepID=A0A1I6SL38_9BACL|nr:endonuclease/exonuclease/phosphatase family protein [Marininema halotolerans]SFS77649.1 Metal-dependent hydrolase, endonuclease/exonuclease/phosphatase family [Marininema halotolerans]